MIVKLKVGVAAVPWVGDLCFIPRAGEKFSFVTATLEIVSYRIFDVETFVSVTNEQTVIMHGRPCS